MDMEIYEMGKEIFNYLKDNFRIYTVEECKQLEKDKGAYGVIYITQCKVNGKLYIGQKMIDTDNFNTYLGSGTILKQAVDKHGRENFERIILEVAYSQEELDEFEIKYIRLFDASEKYNRELFYNIALGGHAGEPLKGENHPNYKPRVKFKCDYCGKEAERLESDIRNKSNLFCSNECHYKWQREQMGKLMRERMQGRFTKYFVIIYPNGEISEEMPIKKMADYLNINETTIRTLAKEKTCYIGTYENIRYIRILYYEDYLKERENKSNEEFINMCKHMVEEAKILYEKKREEVRETCRNKTGENSSRYGKCHSEETKKQMSEIKEGKNNPTAKLVVAILPSGKIIKNVCIKELAKELGVSNTLVRNVLYSHKRYKAPNRKGLEHLKKYDGMIIMYQKDYLNIVENKYCKLSKAS